MRVIPMAVTLACGAAACATVITSPAFFVGVDAVRIDFDTLPADGTEPPIGTPFSDEYGAQGVLFSSEAAPNAQQTTDPGDAAGRFDAPCRYMFFAKGGGFPTSGTRYIGGDIPGGFDVSDMRLDFPTPVTAFGMYVIDNDFTDVRIAAYAVDGTELERVIIPQVSEGGVGYWGLAVEGIAYVIIDGDGGIPLDSTMIDDLSFTIDPACFADFNGDGLVSFADLNIMLAFYGASAGDVLYLSIVDINGDGIIGFADLNALLSSYGDSCESSPSPQ